MGDLIKHVPGMVEALGNLTAWAAEKAAWMPGKGGEIVSTVLFKAWVDHLWERMRRAREEEKISDKFERSQHGQSLLTESLNALWEVRDQERAEAIQRVFLGLAMNPVDDWLGQLEQLQIMRLVSEMTTWEVAFCNALERYSKAVFDLDTAEAYSRVSGQGKNEIREEIRKASVSFDTWLSKDFCRGNSAVRNYLSDAAHTLWEKNIIKHDRSWEHVTADSVVMHEGAFSEFGWKLAQHLYSAEVPTEVEVK